MKKCKDIHSLHEEAEWGQPEAQFQLGRCYAFGRGVRRDPRLAEHWYAKAAEQRHKQALFSLATMYDYGQGVQQNTAKAIRFYRLAGWFSMARRRREEMRRQRSATAGEQPAAGQNQSKPEKRVIHADQEGEPHGTVQAQTG